MNRAKLLLTAALAMLPAAACADMLFLNSGEEIQGRLLSFDGQSALMDCAGLRRRYNIGDIMRLRLVKSHNHGALPIGKDPVFKRLFTRPPSPGSYPDDGLVTLLHDTEITADDAASTVSVRTARYILREGARSAGTAKFSFLSGRASGKLSYGRTVSGPNSEQFTDDITVQEGAEYPDYPFYDKTRSIKFAMPGVQVNTAVDYAYELAERHDSFYPFLAARYFRGKQPSRLERLSVSVPYGKRLVYASPNLKIRPDAYSKNNRTLYEWELKDVDSYKDQPLLPPYRMFAPAVFASFADTWENIRATFEPELAKRLVITPAMRALALKLAPTGLPERDRAEALFNWVNKEIQYQPVPPQDYSYLPTPSDEVFSRKAGNALDKPFVLYALLTAAGLEADFVYLAPSDSFPFMLEIPNIRQFSAAQCLLRMKNGEAPLPLCPLHPYARYTQLPDWLQGANGLRLLGAKNPLLWQNPVNAPEQELLSQTLVYTLDQNGNATAEASEEAAGMQQAQWRELKDLRRDELDKHFNLAVRTLHANASLTGYQLENLQDMTRDIKLRYSYRIDGYAIKGGDRYLAFKLPVTPFSSEETAQETRDLPLYWPLPEKTEQSTNFIIPEGWRLEHLPSNFSAEGPGHSYKAVYEVKGRSIRLHEKYIGAARLLPPEDFRAYKQFREKMAAFGEDWVVISR